MPDRTVSKSYLERVARVEKIRGPGEVATTVLLDADYTRNWLARNGWTVLNGGRMVADIRGRFTGC